MQGLLLIIILCTLQTLCVDSVFLRSSLCRSKEWTLSMPEQLTENLHMRVYKIEGLVYYRNSMRVTPSRAHWNYVLCTLQTACTTGHVLWSLRLTGFSHDIQQNMTAIHNHSMIYFHRGWIVMSEETGKTKSNHKLFLHCKSTPHSACPSIQHSPKIKQEIFYNWEHMILTHIVLLPNHSQLSKKILCNRRVVAKAIHERWATPGTSINQSQSCSAHRCSETTPVPAMQPNLHSFGSNCRNTAISCWEMHCWPTRDTTTGPRVSHILCLADIIWLNRFKNHSSYITWKSCSL